MLSDDDKLKAWAGCHSNPLLFVERVLGAEPMSWQREALKLIPSKDHIAIRSGHNTGKSTFISWLGLWHLCCRNPSITAVAANTAIQLRDVNHAEIMRWSRKLPESIRSMYEWGQERIYAKAVPEEGYITFRTANKSTPEAFAGLHGENLLFIIDEASGLEDIVYENVAGALSSKGALAVILGNPTRSTGYFHKAFHESRWLWHCLHWKWKPTPYNDHRYPEQVAKEYGDPSNVYRIRVLGEFPTSEENAVIPLEAIESAVRREVETTDRRSTVWGLDIARFGDDRCALIKRKGNAILEPSKAWRHRDLMQTCGIVFREYTETPDGNKPVAVNCDVIGIGAGVVDRLRELGMPVYGVNVGESPSDADRFARLRDELWWNARDWFMRRDCKIPDDPALISDLIGPTYKLGSNGKVVIESKDDMKKRGIKSPDIADAFCLTFAGGEYASQTMQAQAIDNHDVISAYEQRHYDRGMQTSAIE